MWKTFQEFIKRNFETIVILIVVVVLSYFFSLTIVNVIDRKLSSISIKIPKPELIIKLSKDGKYKGVDLCTNYKNPEDMTEKEKKEFRLKPKKDMTIQDYLNWLKLTKVEKFEQKDNAKEIDKLLRPPFSED